MGNLSGELTDEVTFKEVQTYVKGKIAERGFDKETTQQKFALLVEEVGELAKALRKQNGIKIADDSATFEIEEEAADVFWSLVAVCNTLNIDLLEAIQLKEKKNATRVWR